jgi:hypothetical protein
MIYSNSENLPMSIDDSMDSCVRMSILALEDSTTNRLKLARYEQDGAILRCPTDSPANNKWNCTPDQVAMWLMATKDVKAVRRVFLRHLKFLGFMDWQRDYPGSWKKPWPHYAQDWVFATGEKKGEPERRPFDFATPTLPARWGMMIIKGKIWPLYPLLPVCFIFNILSILTSIGSRHEVNQLFAECKVYKTTGLMLKLIRDFYYRNNRYWVIRGEYEYAEIINRETN